MPKIKNENYKRFLEKGEIQTLSEIELELILNQITGIRGKYIKQARALIITLYYTGARPGEVLNLKAKNIQKIKTYLVITIPTLKRGLTRPIYLRTKKPLIKELMQYWKKQFPEIPLFYNYTNKYIRIYKDKTYIETTDKLRYYFTKWTEAAGININPYFLRHNRFSKLAEKGATAEEIRQIKGSKTTESVLPYLHLSSRTAKKLSRLID